MRKISSVTDDQPLYSLWWCFYSQSQSAMFFEVAGHIRDLENKFLHRGWWLAPPSLWSRWLHESSVFVCWSLYQWLLPPPNQWHGCVELRDLWLLICAPPLQSLFWWPVWTSCWTFVQLPSYVHLVWSRKLCQSHPRRISYSSCKVFHTRIHKFVIGQLCPLGALRDFLRCSPVSWPFGCCTSCRLFVEEVHKSAITDHVAQHNHVIDWEGAKVIDKDSNKQTRWIREAIWIRKRGAQVINRDEGTYSLSHVYDQLLQRTSHSGIENRNTTRGSTAAGHQ